MEINKRYIKTFNSYAEASKAKEKILSISGEYQETTGAVADAAEGAADAAKGAADAAKTATKPSTYDSY